MVAPLKLASTLVGKSPGVRLGLAEETAERVAAPAVAASSTPSSVSPADVRSTLETGLTGNASANDNGAVPGFSFEENPISALGLLLENVGAALEGRELPSTRLSENSQANRLNQIRAAAARLKLDEALQERATQKADEANLRISDQKFRELGALVDGATKGSEDARTIVVEAAGEDGVFTFEEFLQINDALPAALKFDDNLIDSLRRNPNRLPNFILSEEESRDLAIEEAKPANRRAERRLELDEETAQRADERLELSRQADQRAERADRRAASSQARDERRLDLEEARFEAEKRKVDFNSSATKTALAARSQGLRVDPQLVGEKEAEFVNGIEPDVAAGMLGNLSAQTSDVATRTKDKLAAEEEARASSRIPNDIRRLADIPSEVLTVGDADAQGLTVELETSQLKELQNAKVSARDSIRIADDIAKQVDGRPELLRVPRFLAGFADNIRNSVIGLLRAGNIEVEASTDPGSYAEVLDRLNVQGTELRSATVSLAFAIAREREGSRLTDRDIELALETIGASTANPNAFVNTLRAVQRRIDERFSDLIEVTIGRRPDSLLGGGGPSGGSGEAENLSDLDEDAFRKRLESQGFTVVE